jgi:hypothetical protein|tara:strand:+ start:248 stop:409 length:162 start_codon:yes stop_codon:yes gene_type:complete
MERNTRKILEYKKKLKFKKLQELFNKKKKEVNINEFGSHRYMIKEGVNKGKIL